MRGCPRTPWPESARQEPSLSDPESPRCFLPAANKTHSASCLSVHLSVRPSTSNVGGRAGGQSTQASGSSGPPNGIQGPSPLGSGPFERCCWCGDKGRVQPAGRARPRGCTASLHCPCVAPTCTAVSRGQAHLQGVSAWMPLPGSRFRVCGEVGAPCLTPTRHPRAPCHSDTKCP